MRSKTSITLGHGDRKRLESVLRDPQAPRKQVCRVKVVLLTAEGHGTAAIMRQTGKSKGFIWRWQNRFAAEGIEGLLRDKTRPSRIPPLSQTVIDRVLTLTMLTPPDGALRWTGPAMAKAAGISISSVHRIWKAQGYRFASDESRCKSKRREEGDLDQIGMEKNITVQHIYLEDEE